jgi:protein-L-isoaspartate(D-aspartate) O-methyltransferase
LAATELRLTRRLLLTGAIAAPAILPAISRAAPGAAGAWTRQAYMDAMAKSGRPVDLTQAQFDAIQARKPAAMKRIETYLKEHLGSADPAVMAAFEAVPREYFHYLYDSHRATPGDAYEDNPKPWALGYGSALSDYLGQAYMTQIAKPKPSDVTLEIGTGSGFQSSLLSRIVSHAYSIEIIEPLGRAVGKTRVGDGYFGWPEVKDGFDTIIVTCAAQYAPPDLFKQLKPGGKLIIPIGQPFKRGQFLYVYTKDQEGKIHSRKDVGVFFIPMTGTMMKTPAPGGDQAGAKAPSPSGALEPIKTSLPASEAVKPAG